MLTAKQRDGITEIINIGVGKGSAVLGEMLNSEIILTVPYVNVIPFDSIIQELQLLETPLVHSVEIKFHGSYKGLANIILPLGSADMLASMLAGIKPESPEFEEMKDSVLVEVGNIILNAIMGSFGNVLDEPLDYTPPSSFTGASNDLFKQLDRKQYNEILICKTDFHVEDINITGEILILYEINSFNKLKNILDDLSY